MSKAVQCEKKKVQMKTITVYFFNPYKSITFINAKILILKASFEDLYITKGVCVLWPS